MLKILAGSMKGRSLHRVPKSPHVRPILGRIKKSLFDILQTRINGSRFLDLYAGTGAVGIEALSRGASNAVFVEQEPACIRMIHANVSTLQLTERSEVMRLNALGDLSALTGPFDLVFLGPPYVDEQKKPLALVNPTLINLHKHRLLRETSLVIAQHHKKEMVEPPAPDWALFRQEKYGDSWVSFFKLTPLK